MAGREVVDVGSSEKREDTTPSPTDLEEYLPWACGQLELPFIPVIRKSTISEHGPASNRGKGRDEVTNADSMSGSIGNDDLAQYYRSNANALIYIDVVCDNNNNLIQLKIMRARKIPVPLLKLFSLIAQFHTRLTSIYIDEGLDQSGLYQLNKIIHASHVTEVTLDNTVFEAANYYIILDDNCPLKYLSLARCKLNDTSIKMIASRLNHPLKASKTLSILNLTSNRITDEGAKHLGDMLRANRQLTYLNLSGNIISDVGAQSILSSLMIFPLTDEEKSQKKARKFAYMKDKNKFIRETVEQMRIDFEKRFAAKRKIMRLGVVSTKKSKSFETQTDGDSAGMSIGNIDAIWLEKAQAAAEEMVGPFQDAFNVENTITISGVLYCYGNNVLSYLNLAYNNLTYFSVKKLLAVLNVQNEWDRKPKGLVNVCIEGNNLPETCKELTEIDTLIEFGFASMNSASNTSKKKNVARSK